MSSPSRLKEQVFLSLGPDWFLLLLQGHLHPSTTTLALKLLLYFLSSPSLRGRFRDGLSAGCWVESCMEGVDIVMGECVAVSTMPLLFCPGCERESSPTHTLPTWDLGNPVPRSTLESLDSLH